MAANVKLPIAPSVRSISVAQAAETLGVVPLTISRLIKAKKLRASHVGRRVVIKLVDLDKYLADHEVRS
jgi:excisionase family DNA binding protein